MRVLQFSVLHTHAVGGSAIQCDVIEKSAAVDIYIWTRFVIETGFSRSIVSE
jgi:hypothetical protein